MGTKPEKKRGEALVSSLHDPAADWYEANRRTEVIQLKRSFPLRPKPPSLFARLRHWLTR